jgi:hypothetical protein
MNFQYLFALGMKRKLPDLLTCNEGLRFDVGSTGKYVVSNATPLGPPKWQWPRDGIPANNECVGELHAYHFLEHLSGEDAISFLREVERVLIPACGVFNFSIPYYSTVLANQDLEHKSFWSEETFRNLFENDTYLRLSAGPWKLHIHFLIIAGVVSRNLALVGQIVKNDNHQSSTRDAWFYPAESEMNLTRDDNR